MHALLIDLDAVIYEHEALVPGAPAALAWLFAILGIVTQEPESLPIPDDGCLLYPFKHTTTQ